MISWHDEITALYRRFNPGRLSEMRQILKDFAGFEESLWLTAAKKYGVPELRPSVKELEEVQSLGSARQRVIRMYAHYAPGKLRELEGTLELMRNEGVAKIFGLLVKKYGEEPPLKPVNLHERVLVLYATYNALDRINGLPALLASYDGMEDMLLRRLTNELGPEPHTAEAGDPRNPRERLLRYFDVYNPLGAPRVDLLLSRYRGNELNLFAMMQKQYGREPSEYDVQLFRDRLQRERRRMQDEIDSRIQADVRKREVDRHAKQREVAARMAAIGAESWESSSVMPLEPLRSGVNMERPECLTRMRAHLTNGDQLPEQRTVELVQDIFRAYERQLVPYAQYLLQPRFEASEVPEFFALLDCMYANSMPQHLRASLRTVVSLLEMKHGSTLEEIFVAGGVERFLDRIDPASRDEWALYLTLLHGNVTESELAARNRLRAFYMQYNPGTPLHEVDAVLQGLGHDTASIYAALQRHYGPEPSAIPVDLALVKKILSRNDPSKVKILPLVVEAHCYVGDTAEDVIKRIERTYGRAPNEIDDAFSQFAAEELDARFQIFSAENRVRQVLLRRKVAVDFPDIDVLSSIIAGEPRMRNAETDRLEDEAKRVIDTPTQLLAKDEAEARQTILDQRELHLKSVLELFMGTIDFKSSDCCMELDQLLSRHFILDDESLTRAALSAAMASEGKELTQWLEGRLVWRAKWKADEMREQQAAKREQIRGLLELHAPAAPPPPEPIATVVVSDEHNAEMERLNAELLQRANNIIKFQAQVNSVRFGPRDSVRWRSEVARLQAGEYHRGCVFHREEYVKLVEEERSKLDISKIITVAGDDDSDIAEDAEVDWEGHFLGQCLDYIRSLLTTYEPRRLPTMGELIRMHFGRENELIAALEQQYNVRHWREHNLRNRLLAYYKAIRQENRASAEVPELLRRFADRPQEIWEFLRREYGTSPSPRPPEVRQFLIHRMTQYLAKNAPHLLRECGTMIDRCPDYNCDSLFAKLTSQYGPEERDVEVEVTRLKLVSFYNARGLNHLLSHARVIARRFTPRPALLREVLRRKFNANLDDCEFDPAAITQ